MYGKIVGYCDSDHGIRINQQFWNNVSHYDREQLMFHELGHCALGLDHTQTPTIMYPSMLYLNYYFLNRESLIKQLFTIPKQEIFVTPGSKIECEYEDHF